MICHLLLTEVEANPHPRWGHTKLVPTTDPKKIFTSIPAAGLYLGSIISTKFAANGAPLSPMGSVTPLASPNPLGTPRWVRGPPGPHCHIPAVPAEDSAAAGFCPARKMARELKNHRDIYSDLFFKLLLLFFSCRQPTPPKNNKRVLLPRCGAAAIWERERFGTAAEGRGCSRDPRAHRPRWDGGNKRDLGVLSRLWDAAGWGGKEIWVLEALLTHVHIPASPFQ